MLASIGKLILSSVLRFIWSKAEDWYQRELRFFKYRKTVLKTVDRVAEELADENIEIADDLESIDDSLLRLDKLRQAQRDIPDPAIPVRLFGVVAERKSRDQEGDSVDVPTVPDSTTGSIGDDSESQ